MEDYKQKYEDALETARKINNGEGVATPKDWSILEVIFPELRKSKDELMREELIHFLETCRDPRFVGSRKQDEWIEWLEKQQTTNSESDWNKEDETTFACLIGTLTWTACSEDILKYTHWLENLKQRLNGCK